MNDICTVVASTEENKNGFILTDGALRKMADDAPGKPVWDSFETKNVIGEVRGATVDDDGRLIASFSIDRREINGRYVVPQLALEEGDYEKTEAGLVIHNVGHVCGFSVTNNPADSNITPIEQEAT